MSKERYVGKKVIKTTAEVPWDCSAEARKEICRGATIREVRLQRGNRKSNYVPFSLKLKPSVKQPSVDMYETA